MKALIVYDSYFGNTLKIADEIAKVFGEDTHVILVNYIKSTDLKFVNLLVVGSPILGWKPSEKTQKFLALLTSGQLTGIKATTFDTRMRLFFFMEMLQK